MLKSRLGICNVWYGMLGFKTADIDEKAIRRDNPEDLVVAIAQAKADEIISKLGGLTQFAQDPQPTLLITADTVMLTLFFYYFVFFCFTIRVSSLGVITLLF